MSPSSSEATCTHSKLRLRDAADAHVLFQAVRQGHYPLIRKRLTTPQQQALAPGHVYVWADREGALERWTDGHNWSPSRVRGAFLMYDEMPENSEDSARRKRSAGEKRTGKQPRKKRQPPMPGGLSKQTYSATLVENGSGNQKWHLTAYFAEESASNLLTVEDDPILGAIAVAPGTFISCMSTRRKPKAQAVNADAADHPTHEKPDAQPIKGEESTVESPVFRNTIPPSDHPERSLHSSSFSEDIKPAPFPSSVSMSYPSADPAQSPGPWGYPAPSASESTFPGQDTSSISQSINQHVSMAFDAQSYKSRDPPPMTPNADSSHILPSPGWKLAGSSTFSTPRTRENSQASTHTTTAGVSTASTPTNVSSDASAQHVSASMPPYGSSDTWPTQNQYPDLNSRFNGAAVTGTDATPSSYSSLSVWSEGPYAMGGPNPHSAPAFPTTARRPSHTQYGPSTSSQTRPTSLSFANPIFRQPSTQIYSAHPDPYQSDLPPPSPAPWSAPPSSTAYSLPSSMPNSAAFSGGSQTWSPPSYQMQQGLQHYGTSFPSNQTNSIPYQDPYSAYPHTAPLQSDPVPQPQLAASW